MEREFIQQSELDEQTSKFLLTIAGRDSDCGELTKRSRSFSSMEGKFY